MSTLNSTLTRLADDGFSTLPSDQAMEAIYRHNYFLAFKPIVQQDSLEITGLHIVLANLTQFQFIWSPSMFKDLPITLSNFPIVEFGFCGSTLMINKKGYDLSELQSLNKNPPIAKTK